MSTEALYNGGRPGAELAWSRGLHYGDGVFRTALIWQDEIVDLERQLDLLERDARQLGLHPPPRLLLRSEALQLAADQPRGVLKLMLFRRAGGRGYRAEHAEVDRLLLRQLAPRYPESHWTAGIRAFLSPLRLATQPRLAGVKHLNRLEQVLASRDWPEDAEEGFVCDAAGRPVCGTRSNLFWVRDGVLATPVLDQCGIRGMMRNKIIELAQQLQIPVQLETTGMDALCRADEIFVSNSLIGLWPVRDFAGLRLHAPGPLTQRLQHALQHPRLV